MRGGALTLPKRRRHEYLRTQLTNEQSSWLPLWRDIDDYILPNVGRFNLTDTNRGDRRSSKILDDTATAALETLAAGMLSGMTSPARPWFRLTTPDPGLAQFEPVKEWLHTVAERLSAFFLQSNLYQSLPINYLSTGGFGTGAMLVEEDFETLLRCYTFPVGSYMLANGARGKVEVFFRQYRRTIRQIVEQFGAYNERTGAARWDNFSPYVKNQYDNSNYETWVDINHVIEPNPEFDPKRLHSKFKRYSSCYYEAGRSSAANSQSYVDSDSSVYLRESGYDYFPVLCARWKSTADDAYGTLAPGIRMLGDVKQLQHGENRALQAIDKQVTPPVSQPVSMKGQPLSHLPGGTSWHDDNSQHGAIKTLYEVNLDLQHLDARQELCRRRIDRAAYKHLFEKFLANERSGTTATEVNAARDEQLLQVGPVVSQLNEDQNDPLISIGFMMMLRQGWVPEPPKEIQGIPLKVDYISPMAQAQKLVGIGSLERFLSIAGTVVKVFPDSVSKINPDKLYETAGDQLGLPPGIVRSDEEAQAIKDAIAKAQQQQQMAETIERASGAAKNLSQADMQSDNALTRLMNKGGSGQ